MKQPAFVAKIYLEELRRQAVYAEAAFVSMELARAASDVYAVFMHLHAFLGHAANASKLLWPGRSRTTVDCKRARARGKRLRKALGSGMSTLTPLKARTLRDHLEHFDERLDAWAADAGTGFVDSNIGSLDSFALSLPSQHRLRHYDPARGLFIFRDEEHSVSALRTALQTLPGTVDAVLQDPARLSAT